MSASTSVVACGTDGDDLIVSDANLRDGLLTGGDVYEGDYVWQPLPGHWNYVTRRSVADDGGQAHAQLFDASVPVVAVTGVAYTRRSINGANQYAPLRIQNRNFGIGTVTLDDSSARADLAWAAVRYACDDGIVNVEAYQRPGHEPGPLWDIEEREYFLGQPSRVLAACEAIAIIGEHIVGGDFRWAFTESGPYQEIMDDMIRPQASLLHGDWINPTFTDAAFGRTDVRLLSLRGTVSNDGVFTAAPFGRTLDDDFIHGSDASVGEYRWEADCGLGYQLLRPLDASSRYQSPLSDSALRDEVDELADIYEGCDVRWGMFVEGPLSDEQSGQLDGG